ncbi:MAG TPA: cytochrome c [Bryobacteraceae bacterium]|jgi:mono/diheme cytochrome c family protein|nr:cytochrome c [Bryobacteraceae bacterium]
MRRERIQSMWGGLAARGGFTTRPKRRLQVGAQATSLPHQRSKSGLLWVGGYCALPLACILIALAFLSGCSSVQRVPPLEVWDDMKRQGKFKPQMENDLFADHRDSRVPPAGVVARGHQYEDTVYSTGMVGEMYVGKSPVPITMEQLKKGQAKFTTYCTPCHDRTGTGQGIVPLHVPTWQPANLMEDRIVQFADGEIFTVMSDGRRTMPAYKYQVSIEDRWAIIAYLRVLQRAAHGSMNDVPADQKSALEKMN